MVDVQEWRLKGDWFDLCKCSIPCPCTFAQPPSEGDCDGILAWRINEGSYGDVDVSGLNVVVLGSFVGNIWDGTAHDSYMAIYIDDRADATQAEALEMIWRGQAGGWMEVFSGSTDEIRAVEKAPIEIQVAEDLSSWRVEVRGVAQGVAEALSGPTSPPGTRVQVHNPPGAEVGPGQVATWGVATLDRADGFGFKWERSGKSSKHFPFDWTGPGG